METTERSRDAQASGDGCAMEVLGNFLVWPFLDQAQNEQLALRVREIIESPEDSRWKRPSVIDGLKVGIHDSDREAQTLPSAVLDPSLSKG
jgi:hypothetical protein